MVKHLLFLLLFICTTLSASKIKTPSDVYAEAILLKEKVLYLRKKHNVQAPFPNIPTQTNKAPRHVLQKSLEVLSKVNRYRIIHNYGPIAMPEYPSREITPSDVFDYVKRLNEEVTPFIQDTSLLYNLTRKTFQNKTPNDVYALLWSVSLAFDPLLGIRGFTPTDVYEQSETIVAIAKFLRQSQGNFTKIERPKVSPGLHPNHALNTSYKLLRKIAKVEKRLWIKQTEIPQKEYKVITPTQVYDSLQNIIAEMQRIKTRLGIERHFEIKKVKEAKTPSDVVANLEYAILLLPDFSVEKELKQYDPALLAKTPNDVFALTQKILEKLYTIAAYKGINVAIQTPPYIYDLSPRHVYQKGIESIEKAIKFKSKEGFYLSNTPSQPYKQVTPSEVYELVERLDSTITLILQQNYNKKIIPYKYTFNKKIYYDKTPSDVYNNLWKISRVLDRLNGSEYTPNETYILAQHIESKIDAILEYFKIKNSSPSKEQLMQEEENKSPKDVFNESLKLYSSFKKILKRANLKSENIIIPHEKKITPNSVYNALRIITASINAFEINYGIQEKERYIQTSTQNKTPSDVYARIKSANLKLNRLFDDDNY